MISQGTERNAPAEKVRAEQARKDRRGRTLMVVATAAVVAVIAGGTVWAVRQSNGATSGTASGTASVAGLRAFTNLARDHVNGLVRYPQSPPVGGAHSPVWQNCGWYDTPVANENAVHSLEHAAVWVTYRPELSSADKAKLKAELSGRQYVLASAYPGLAAPVVATAWGYQVALTGVDDPRLAQFVTQFANSPTAPEPGGECTGGLGNPA